MARRRKAASRTRTALNSDFAMPLGALVLLGLLYLAYRIGIIEAVAGIPIGILSGG